MKPKTRSLWAILALAAVWLAVAGQRRLVLREYVLDGVLFLVIAAVLFLVAVSRKRGGEELGLWPYNVTVSHGAEGVALVGDHSQRVLLVATVLLSAIAFASLSNNRFTSRGVFCWLAAVLSWLVAMARVHPHRHALRLPDTGALRDVVHGGTVVMRSNWTTVVLISILALAVFFRVYQIDRLPTEPNSDHVEASLDIRDILNGQYRIFFPRNTGREATQFYLTAAMSHIFGYGFVTLKLTMALVGSLNVIPMYFLGKELSDKRFGLLAAFFMAISYWHTIVSRIGWRIVLASFWTTVTLYFLLRALRTGRRNDYLLTGLSLGAGLYGYMSFRVAPLLVVALFLLKPVVDRGRDFKWNRFVTNGALLVVTSMLVYLPMLRYMYDEPRMLWYRVLTRTTGLERPMEQSTAAIFMNNVKRALQMFNWSGDSVWVQSVPFRPTLDYVSGGLLVLGAAYMLYLLLAKRRPIALYLLVAILVLLLPSTMAIAFPVENPSNTRASGVIPVIILLTALPVYLVASQVATTLRGGTGIALVVFLGGMLLCQATRLNFRAYFVDYYQNYRRSAWNASEVARVMRGFGDSIGSIYDAYIISTPYWEIHEAVGLLLGDITWGNVRRIGELQAHLAEPRNRLYVFNPNNRDAEHWLREHYPNGRLMRYQAFIPEKDFMIFLAPAEL